MPESLEPIEMPTPLALPLLVECRPGVRWRPVFWCVAWAMVWFLVLATALPMLPGLLKFAVIEWAFLGGMGVAEAVFYLTQGLRYSVVAGQDGLTWCDGWNRKSARWDEVTDYYYRWPNPVRPPRPIRRVKSGATLRLHRRFGEPNELCAVVATAHGDVVLPPGTPRRQDFCELVRHRSHRAEAGIWEAKEYRIPGGEREFKYKLCPREILLASVYSPLVVLPAIWPMCSPAGVLSAHFLFHDRPIDLSAQVFGAAIWAPTVCVSMCCHYLWARRKCWDRRGERMLVTETALIWEKTEGGQTWRLEMPWDEIRSLQVASLVGLFWSWKVCAEGGKMLRFYPWLMRDGRGLPAIITDRAPVLRNKESARTAGQAPVAPVPART